MASTPATENQSLENNLLDPELIKVERENNGGTIISSQQGIQDKGQAMDTQIPDSDQISSAQLKSLIQQTITSTSQPVTTERTSQDINGSIPDSKDSYNDKSILTYLESINSRLDSLSYLPFGTENLGETFQGHDEIPGSSIQTQRRKVELYGQDVGPKLYEIKGNLVTPPIIAKNLLEAFDGLPIHGRPEPNEDVEKFNLKKIRDFVGFDLNDEEFENLGRLCSPASLRTGKELRMTTPVPTLSVLSVLHHNNYDEEGSKLFVVKKHRLRLANDPSNNYPKRLKYRGIRLIPLRIENGSETPPADLEPGKDLIYVVRIYRPFPYNLKERHSSRHSVFSRDIILVGRQPLSALRDRIVCANDVSTRLDTADAPDDVPDTCAKDIFPSGFLFINNVFYVDERVGCVDRSAPLRAWARQKGLGEFHKRDLNTRIDELDIRLGHPEVYLHQGNCEHLFTFSEIRLLNPDDPLSITLYPAHTSISQNQSVYCTTCAEFGAKWIVTGCSTVPFDPAYFCETCYKMYLYKDGKKIGDFKSYAYRGNEINVLKPSG